MVDNYNEITKVNGGNGEKPIIRDDKKIKWTRSLENKYKKGELIKLDNSNVRLELYRPFTKKYVFYQKDIIESPGQWYEKFGTDNLVIVTTGKGTRNGFSAIVSNCMPSLDLMEKGQGFMRYDNSEDLNTLFESTNSNLNQAFANKIGLSLDDTFAYIYGLLNSPEYKQKYANDLSKDLARIPIVKNKEKYVEVGRKLINLHINYETIEPYSGCEIEVTNNPSYYVKQMKFAKKRNLETGRLERDYSTINFNSDIKIKKIPEKAYNYIISGKSAIEWIMDRYKVISDSKSGITDDPNDFSDDPKYIFNLLLRVINVSIQTIDLIHQLPKFEIEE